MSHIKQKHPSQYHNGRVGETYGERQNLVKNQSQEQGTIDKIKDFFSPFATIKPKNFSQFSGQDHISINNFSQDINAVRLNRKIENGDLENALTDQSRIRFLDSILKTKV